MRRNKGMSLFRTNSRRRKKKPIIITVLILLVLASVPIGLKYFSKGQADKVLASISLTNLWNKDKTPDKDQLVGETVPDGNKDTEAPAQETKDDNQKDNSSVNPADNSVEPEDNNTEPEVSNDQSQDGQAVYTTMMPPSMIPKSGDGETPKIAYLTFDDGPTVKVTPQVLDILKENDIKATFFIIGDLAEKNSSLIKRAVDEGHIIGNHSYTHKQKELYADTNSFIGEIEKTEGVLNNILGPDFKTTLTRFPGGGFGSQYDPYKIALLEKGYVYIGWNAVNGDTEGHNVPAEKLLENIKKTVNGKNRVIVLMHDAANKQTTVDALPSVIKYLKEEGYEFRTLEE